MIIPFLKYHGAGNDFILIDNRVKKIVLSEDDIQHLCCRRYGVGADGLILLEPHDTADYKMVYYNNDGSQSLCGNGSRCCFAFAHWLGAAQDQAVFDAIDGQHQVQFKNGTISIRLHDLSNIQQEANDWLIDNGSLHYVTFVDDVSKVDVIEEGRAIRNRKQFAKDGGTNVNFVQLQADKILVRTYERGVEDETLSCGTGAVASAIATYPHHQSNDVNVVTKGGKLRVNFEKENNQFINIWLSGEATKVYEGKIELKSL